MNDAAMDYFWTNAQYGNKPQQSQGPADKVKTQQPQLNIVASDRNKVSIKDDKGNVVQVPSTAYTETLEKKIENLENVNRTQKGQISHLHNHLVQLSKIVNGLKGRADLAGYDSEY